MSAAAPKLSRFWGATPRRIKWFAGFLLILLVCAIFAVGVLLFRNIFWKINANYFAGQAGAADAKMYYSHGSRRLLEIAVIDESGKSDANRVPNMFEMEPTGRQTDGYDIYFFYISPSGPQRITAQTYVKEFNHWMRTIYANPDWFGTNGEPLPDSGRTNRTRFKRIPE